MIPHSTGIASSDSSLLDRAIQARLVFDGCTFGVS